MSDKRDISRDILKTLKGIRPALMWIAGFSALLNVLYLTTPLYMLQIYDRVLNSGSRDTLFYLSLVALLALILLALLDFVRGSLLSRSAQWLRKELGPRTLAAAIQARNLGETQKASRAQRDLASLQDFFDKKAIAPFFDIPFTPLFLALIFVLHPWLGLVATVTGCVLLATSIINDIMLRKRQLSVDQVSSMLSSVNEDAIRASDSVAAMNMGPAFEHRWYALNSKLSEQQLSTSELGGGFQAFARFMRMLAQIAILGIGALLVLNGSLSAGAMIAGSILMGRALAPIDQSISAWRGFISARQAAHRLGSLFSQHPEPNESTALPAPNGHLSVEHVFVGQDHKNLILSDVTFTCGPGELIAIAGPSGSGKSSLCRTLTNVQPLLSGTVSLDGASMKTWPREQLGDTIGYMPQTVTLFSATVRENIARLKESEAKDVIAAAMHAGAHEMILSLPDGYDTQVGPGGLPLSGGQTQRIGLARAVYGSPRLVILDEPNAHLDQDGETALLNCLRSLRSDGATILVVAHRKSILSVASKLLVLQEGRMTQFSDIRTEDNPKVTTMRGATP